jgi:hypothetical protein
MYFCLIFVPYYLQKLSSWIIYKVHVHGHILPNKDWLVPEFSVVDPTTMRWRPRRPCIYMYVLSVLDYEKCSSGYFYLYCNTGSEVYGDRHDIAEILLKLALDTTTFPNINNLVFGEVYNYTTICDQVCFNDMCQVSGFHRFPNRFCGVMEVRRVWRYHERGSNSQR